MAGKLGSMKIDNGVDGSETVNVEFPANSHKARGKGDMADKKVSKVITGVVVTKKKSFFKKLKETFLGDDTENVSSYIIYDVLIPAGKDTIEDLVRVILRGDTKGTQTRRDQGKSFVSYNKYYDKSDKRRERPEPSRASRSRHNFDDIILETRGEAEEVLSHLVDLTEDYGMACVADLYDLVGIESNFTDNKYGWTNLREATVSRVRNGYLITLPRTRVLE